MNRSNGALWVTATALLLALGCCARDQDTQALPASGGFQDAEEKLAAMGAALGTAQAFSFTTSQRRERVNARGERSVRTLNTEVLVRRPDGFVQRLTTDEGTASVVYDGASLSLQSDREEVWTQVAMPSTLDDALDTIAAFYPMPMPLADLLYADPAAAIRGAELDGEVVGREAVGARSCDRLALRTEHVDIDLWLEADARALPCKMDLVYKSAEGTPRWSIAFDDWNLQPEVDPARFAFEPQPSYRRIQMVAVLSAEDEAAARTGSGASSHDGDAGANDSEQDGNDKRGSG